MTWTVLIIDVCCCDDAHDQNGDASKNDKDDDSEAENEDEEEEREEDEGAYCDDDKEDLDDGLNATASTTATGRATTT